MHHDRQATPQEQAESATSSRVTGEWLAVYWRAGRFHEKRFRCACKLGIALAKAFKTFCRSVHWITEACFLSSCAHWLGIDYDWPASSGTLQMLCSCIFREIGGCSGWWSIPYSHTSPCLRLYWLQHHADNCVRVYAELRMEPVERWKCWRLPVARLSCPRVFDRLPIIHAVIDQDLDCRSPCCIYS